MNWKNTLDKHKVDHIVSFEKYYIASDIFILADFTVANTQ